VQSKVGSLASCIDKKINKVAKSQQKASELQIKSGQVKMVFGFFRAY